MFALESEMIPVIQSCLSGLLEHPGTYAWASELPVNSRLVDMAVAPIHVDSIESTRELLLKLRRLSMVQLDYLALVAEQTPVSIRRLCEASFLSAPRVHEVFLDEFISMGLVRRETRYTYSLTEWADALPPYLVAIEAKLDKWQDAVHQATDNQGFASLSFIAMDSDRLPRSATYLRECQESGLGLLGVRSSGDIEMVLQPRRVRTPGRDHWLQGIRLVRDLVSSRNSKWMLGGAEFNRR